MMRSEVAIILDGSKNVFGLICFDVCGLISSLSTLCKPEIQIYPDIVDSIHNVTCLLVICDMVHQLFAQFQITLPTKLDKSRQKQTFSHANLKHFFNKLLLHAS